MINRSSSSSSAKIDSKTPCSTFTTIQGMFFAQDPIQCLVDCFAKPGKAWTNDLRTCRPSSFVIIEQRRTTDRDIKSIVIRYFATRRLETFPTMRFCAESPGQEHCVSTYIKRVVEARVHRCCGGCEQRRTCQSPRSL